MSGMEYKDLKKEFEDCEHLRKAAEKIAKLDLTFVEANSSSDLLDSLENVTSIFKVIAPAWKKCPNIRSSKDKKIKKVTSMLEIFANPSTYNLYTIALNAFENWREVNKDINKAIAELKQTNCARAGFIFGKILR